MKQDKSNRTHRKITAMPGQLIYILFDMHNYNSTRRNRCILNDKHGNCLKGTKQFLYSLGIKYKYQNYYEIL